MTATPPRKRIRTRSLMEAKRAGKPIAALTAYDAPTATIFDDAGIDLLLVGDSAANVVLGERTTLSITIETLLTMTNAVVGATRTAMVVADLPFGSYEASDEQAVVSAVRFMKEAGAHAVKLEGGARMASRIRAIVAAGVPVVAHIGYTPQAEHSLGGYIVQGRGEGAQALQTDLTAVTEAGAFAVVLEMVPAELAAKLSQTSPIPTIGIGAGSGCDGQILVWQDAFGLNSHRVPSFVRQYANLREVLHDAATRYVDDVRSRAFPSAAESFTDEPKRPSATD